MRGAPQYWTLIHLKYRKHIKAEHGGAGSGGLRHGANGKDIILDVPLGTVARNAETGELICEILEPWEEKILVKGGRGGKGNDFFKSATMQTPRFAQEGEPGQEGWFILELKLLADVGLVGFPNAGKSTLLNAITGAGIPANNRLFDTLDTTTRLLTVSDTLDVVISDTVGFIRKLPHQLVEAFKATLEELEYADLLLHVIDLSNPQWAQQAQVVDDLIRELKADHIPCLRVYNKCDLAFSGALPREKDSVYISAKTGEGIKRLLQAVDEKLDKGTRRVTIHLPYDKAGLLDGLYREAKVENVEYGETVDITAVCTPRIMGQLKDYIEGLQEEKEDWEQ